MRAKRIILSLVLMLSLASLHAASWPDGTGYNDPANNSNEATFLVGFQNNIPDKVSIGFISENISDFTAESNIEEEKIRHEVSLYDASGTGIAANGENKVFLYYQVLYSGILTVSLALENPLSSDSGSKLGWTVSWTTPSNSGDYLKGGIDCSEKSSAEVVAPIHSHENVNMSAGIKELTISTHDYRGKPLGLYYGYVKVMVATDGE